MSVVAFSRDEMAKWYADKHLRTDPGIRTVYYLPTGAPEREIRLLEINELIAERASDVIEPLDFGVDIDSDDPLVLLVVDATPSQWDRIRKGELSMPPGWSLDAAISYSR